jgi:hypothetical protein
MAISRRSSARLSWERSRSVGVRWEQGSPSPRNPCGQQPKRRFGASRSASLDGPQGLAPGGAPHSSSSSGSSRGGGNSSGANSCAIAIAASPADSEAETWSPRHVSLSRRTGAGCISIHLPATCAATHPGSAVARRKLSTSGKIRISVSRGRARWVRSERARLSSSASDSTARPESMSGASAARSRPRRGHHRRLVGLDQFPTVLRQANGRAPDISPLVRALAPTWRHR